MGVNAIVDNSASQQMAVAMSNSVAVELKELEQKDRKDSNAQRVQDKSDVAKLLQEGTSPSKAGMNILVSLAGKLATVGVNLKPERFSGKAQDAMEDELNQLRGGDQNFDDMVEIRNAVGRVNGRKDQKGNNNQHGQERGALLDKEVQASVREYASLYAQFTVSHSPEIRKKLDRLETELRQKGLTNKDFISIKTAASNSIRKELAQQVKDAFLKKVLTPEKSVEMVVQDKNLNDILDFALLRGLHDNESLQMLADDVMVDTAEELKDFAREKIEERLVRQHLSTDEKGDKQTTNELKDLLKLAAKVGLDLNQFTDDWQVKQFDLGMFVPDMALGQGGANADPQGQPSKNPYEYTKDDEKDLQLDRLRALHMHRALTGDWSTMLDTHFKMRKLKNGLIKLGVSSNELDRIEKEGVAAARLRLLEMLKGVLEERATLYELAGPAFKLIEQKIKGILSNLERLDWKLEEVEFHSLRDTANMKVFDAARDEFLTLRDMLKGFADPSIEKRYKLVLKLLKRLREESKLEAEVPEEFNTMKEAA
jgi:hypothetical protein